MSVAASIPITTRFWYSKQWGNGARRDVTCEWEMHGVSGKVRVKGVETDRRIRFEWDGNDRFHPTKIEFLFDPCEHDWTRMNH